MQYRKLGHSGLLVSKFVLGTVPFGGKAGFEKPATLTPAKRAVLSISRWITALI